MSIWAIGDIHGCARTLQVLLERIAPTHSDHLVFVGDYTDRGPRSREVIDILLQLETAHLAEEGPACTFLRGNHDQMMLDWIERGVIDLWRQNGGLATLSSYSEEDGWPNVPPEHADFLRRTKLYFETDEFVFVHAGLNPFLSVKANLESNDEFTFLWTRDHLRVSFRNWEKTVVCGHTPMPKPLLDSDLIAIDTGCVFKSFPELGNLTAVRLPEREVISVPNQE